MIRNGARAAPSWHLQPLMARDMGVRYGVAIVALVVGLRLPAPGLAAGHSDFIATAVPSCAVVRDAMESQCCRVRTWGLPDPTDAPRDGRASRPGCTPASGGQCS